VGGNGNGRGGRNRNVLREEHDVTAAGTFSKMRETLGAFVFRQHAFDKSV
jgi:hypothetical protein